MGDGATTPPEEQPDSGDLAPNPRLLAIAKALRKVLPGDSRFGDDPLSTAGEKQSQVLGRRLAEATAERPTLLREAGYRTAAFTEDGFLVRPKGFGEGFSRYVENRKRPERPRDARVTFGQARRWLEENREAIEESCRYVEKHGVFTDIRHRL